jgi:toxin ParE1/3/4
VDIRFGSAALDELQTASYLYSQQRDGLGEEFVDEVQRVCLILSEHPDIGRPLLSGRRVLPINRFPYRLVYIRDESTIRILAVSHMSQHPFYWRHRVEEPRPDYGVAPLAV